MRVNVFNDLLKNQYANVPISFKSGVINTIFKKGDPLLINNLRPITLLTTSCYPK
eukprot:gene2392-2959_t